MKVSDVVKGAKNNPYFLTSIYLYFNFFIHGVGVIAISQNMGNLVTHYGTDEAGVMYVLSGMGLGRFLSYFASSFFAERLKRKSIILGGIGLYILFFVGVLLSPSIGIAFCFAVLGGVANACLDVGTYPALMDAYPKSPGTAVIFCKATVSLGQMFYPLFVGYLIVQGVWFGYSLIFPAVLLALNAFLISLSRFADPTKMPAEDIKHLPVQKRKPHPVLDGGTVILFGFAIYATFHTALIWLPQYVEAATSTSKVISLRTISFYSIGSLLGVFLTGGLVSRWLRTVAVLTVFPVIAASAALFIYFFPTIIICNVGAFVIGFTAAGGILQLGLSVVSEYFPDNKAKITGIYMLFGSLANFLVPLITAKINTVDTRYIMLFDASLALMAAVLGFIIFLRYYRIFTIQPSDIRLGERYCIRKISGS